MKNFDWTAFSVKILIKASMEDIYNAWCKSSELEKWFLKSATYYNNEKKSIGPDEPCQTGYFYSWSWYLHDAVENGKIILANGRDRVQFTFEGDCLVEVKLSEKLEYTQVELFMRNIPTDELSKQEIRLGCQSGWSFYLVNLKSIYEGGVDLRNRDERMNIMVNN
jgi:uncharacterized protein YndB with AHSA1/START domain